MRKILMKGIGEITKTSPAIGENPLPFIKKKKEEKDPKCKEKGCSGVVLSTKPVRIRTGCRSFSTAYSCSKCERLYWLTTEKKLSGVRNRKGRKAFLKDS